MTLSSSGPVVPQEGKLPQRITYLFEAILASPLYDLSRHIQKDFPVGAYGSHTSFQKWTDCKGADATNSEKHGEY